MTRSLFSPTHILESPDTNFMHEDLVLREMERRQEHPTQDEEDMIRRQEDLPQSQEFQTRFLENVAESLE
jgi:hypothetical protein